MLTTKENMIIADVEKEYGFTFDEQEKSNFILGYYRGLNDGVRQALDLLEKK